MDEAAREKLKKLVSKIVGLPTLPSILAKINQMMLDPNTSAQQVGALISGDPTMASRVLRIVNSSFYGFPNRINTVSHAIVILGFNSVKSIVLSSSIFDAFGAAKKKTAYDRSEFWKHSIGCGVACRVIARRLGMPAEEEFFIAGLLHDIGKIILDQHLHNQFEDVLSLVDAEDVLMLEAEERVIGVTHAELGGWLFTKWGLHTGLVAGVTHHHLPATAPPGVVYPHVIHLADILTRALGIGSGGDRRIPRLDRDSWFKLWLDEMHIEPLLVETDAEFDKAIVFLDFIK